MVRPIPAPIHGNIDLKLGIKSSLPSVKPTIALLFLLWKIAEKPSTLTYAIEEGNKIKLQPELENKLYEDFSSHCTGTTKEQFNEILSKNLMLNSQLEALMVTFELVWKVAKIRFADGRANGSERSGGSRFPKTLWFTANMDLFDIAFKNDTSIDKVLYNWLGINVDFEHETEESFIRFLTFLSESAYYKLKDEDNDVIFNLESLYSTILSNETAVDISGDAEAKGSLRILKSALTEDLYYNLDAQNNSVSGKNLDYLKSYSERVATLHQLNPNHYMDNNDETLVEITTLNFESKLVCDLPRNRILFGAPGTGKSHTLNEEVEKLIKDMNAEYERVTFHPDYSYANFVGTYKPVPTIDDDGKESITYKYVPGPFMRVLKKALENANTPGATPRPFVLVIEEINRANVAAVFGDVFQLLDRDESNCSEYKIEASEDLKKHLADELHCSMEAVSELKIPNNMFIWATMNSADQGVFPMDTAFKRRWDFTYLGIDNSDEKIAGKTVTLGKGDYKRVVEWNKLRKTINGVLSSKDFKINEDKLMGPYFLSTKVIPLEGEIDDKKFIDAFKSKVIMYLFEDAAKQKKHTLFKGCTDTTRYSSIRDEFDTKGVFIFCEEIHNQFPASENVEGETE